MLEIQLQLFGGRGAGSGNFSNSVIKNTVYHGTNIDNIKSFKTDGKERKYIQEAKAQGKDGVVFDNGETDKWYKQTFYAVFDSKQVKILNKRKI